MGSSEIFAALSSSPDSFKGRQILKMMHQKGYHPPRNGDSFSVILSRNEKVDHVEKLNLQEQQLIQKVQDIMTEWPQVELDEEEVQQEVRVNVPLAPYLQTQE